MVAHKKQNPRFIYNASRKNRAHSFFGTAIEDGIPTIVAGFKIRKAAIFGNYEMTDLTTK